MIYNDENMGYGKTHYLVWVPPALGKSHNLICKVQHYHKYISGYKGKSHKLNHANFRHLPPGLKTKVPKKIHKQISPFIWCGCSKKKPRNHS